MPMLALTCSALAIWFVLQDKVKQPNKQSEPNATIRDATRLDELQSGDAVSATRLLEAGQLAFSQGKLELAESSYRQAVKAEPNNPQHRLWLGRLLFASGRTFEARSIWTPLLKTGGIDLLTMPMLGNSEVKFETETESIRKGLLNSPDDSTRLANASLLLEERDIDQTRELLKPIHTQS